MIDYCMAHVKNNFSENLKNCLETSHVKCALCMVSAMNKSFTSLDK